MREGSVSCERRDSISWRERMAGRCCAPQIEIGKAPNIQNCKGEKGTSGGVLPGARAGFERLRKIAGEITLDSLWKCVSSTPRNGIRRPIHFFQTNEMAVALRLRRAGSKDRPFYHIVAADSRAKRDGRFIEIIGNYNPMQENDYAVDLEKAEKWLGNGAKPSDTVNSLIRKARKASD